MSKEDQERVGEGVLTLREATQLPQWAKSTLIRLRRDARQQATRMNAMREASEGSPWSLVDGIMDLPIGERGMSVRAKFGPQRDQTVEMDVLPDGVRILGGSALTLELNSSNHFLIKLAPR